ncbi:MAG: ATP-binding cassette domain-containing protein [Puniceicoccales bacterium]|jgi:putative ABC transport system ATP-binding protein|nr:ATP-binding cassette domain-containing protein [Puniceicoccales bacterium]
MLQLQNINVSVCEGAAPSRVILRDINLHVHAGEFAVIVGGNGAGKSTLFNAIGGAIIPTAGDIIIGGENVTKLPQHKRSRYVARVVQDTASGTMSTMTVFENLSFAFMRGKRRKMLPYGTSARLKLFSKKLENIAMGLEKRMHDTVEKLSGGQRQIISLLMATLSPSKILLLDEITASLDPKVSDLTMKIANEMIERESRTTLMVTHNMSHAAGCGNRLLLLKNHHFTRDISGNQKKNITAAELARMVGEI